MSTSTETQHPFEFLTVYVFFLLFFFLTLLFTSIFLFFFFNDPAPTEIYPLPLHDALPICRNRLYPLLDRETLMDIVTVFYLGMASLMALGGYLYWLANHTTPTRPPSRPQLVATKIGRAHV